MTQINLRKAAAAVQVLNTEIVSLRQTLDVASSLKLSIFGDYDTFFKEEREKFENSQSKLDAYTEVLYSIRNKVSVVNERHGVDALLNNIALIDQKISNATIVVKSSVVNEMQTKQKLASTKEKQKTGADYYGADEITISVVTREDVEAVQKKLSSLKREKRQLQDDLLSANIENKISLSDVEKKILEDLGVI